MTIDDARHELSHHGHALVDAGFLSRVAGTDTLESLRGAWDGLPLDPHLRDGGRYRSRRHASFIDADTLADVPHRPHWQPRTYNALHGGLVRWFEPIEAPVAGSLPFRALVHGLGRLFAKVRPADRWFVEAHQFRIDTAGGIGRPTPEGAHRDGVDFVAVILVARTDVTGGETRVFESNGPGATRFTMDRPFTALLLDDTRVVHETTPIQPDGPANGHRDTLVLTYRGHGFQDPG